MNLLKTALVLLVPLAAACLAEGEDAGNAGSGSDEAAEIAAVDGADLAIRTPTAALAREATNAAAAKGGVATGANDGVATGANDGIPLLCGFSDPAQARLVVTDEKAFDQIIAEKRDLLARLRSGKVQSRDLVAQDVSLDAWHGSVSLEVRNGSLVLAGGGAVKSVANTKNLEDKTLMVVVKGAGDVHVAPNVTDAGLKNLFIALDGSAHDVDLGAALPCAVVDGGAEAAAGPLRFQGATYHGTGYTPLTDIYGTNGNDYLYGGSGNDNMLGYGGYDTIVGYAGNDSIAGGDGDDTCFGGVGSDSVNGNAGNDSVRAEGTGYYPSGDYDVVRGGQGNDYVYGESTSASTADCYGDLDYDYCGQLYCNTKSSCEATLQDW